MPKPNPSGKDPDARGADLWLMTLHDFRQSIQSLWGLAPIVGSAGNGASQADPRKLETLITGLASAMTDMIEAVTAIAKLEAGERGAATRATVSLDGLLSQCCQGIGDLADQRGAGLVLHACPGKAATDAFHARAVLHGCLLTALKLTEGGGPVEVTGELAGDTATITIAYSGIDPAPALQRTAFVELPGLASTPAQPFVGLGLALCARLATALDGALTIGRDARGRHLLLVALPQAR